MAFAPEAPVRSAAASDSSPPPAPAPLPATPRGLRLRGVVVDDTGAPVPGATWRLLEIASCGNARRSPRPPHEGRCLEGAIESRGDVAGWTLLRIEAEAAGHCRRSIGGCSESLGEPFQLVLPRAATLAGSVSRRAGGPAAGVVVAVADQPDTGTRTALGTSDVNGAFRIEGVDPRSRFVRAGAGAARPLILDPGEVGWIDLVAD